MVAHRTAEEIEYIDSIGTHRGNPSEQAEKRRDMSRETKMRWLKDYLRVAENRSDWGEINKDEVIQHVHEEIEKLRDQ